jgi:hypothetical protein
VIHYDAMTLIDDNMLLVDVDCPRCGASCRCEDGCDDAAFYDLTTLLHNLAVAGALHRAYVEGRVDGIKDGQFLARFE